MRIRRAPWVIRSMWSNPDETTINFERANEIIKARLRSLGNGRWSATITRYIHNVIQWGETQICDKADREIASDLLVVALTKQGII